MDGRKHKSAKSKKAQSSQDTKNETNKTADKELPKKISKVAVRESFKKGKKGQERTDESIQDSLHGRSSATEPSQW